MKTLPYSFVPGKKPHPLRDPDGHRMGGHNLDASAFQQDQWRDSDVYRWGIHLFNAGYYWESHECWEAVWRQVGRRGDVADLLKGLIKLAAAGVKAREGRPRGVRSHALRAQELFQRCSQQGQQLMLGLNLKLLIASSRQLEKAAESIVNASDEAVAVVMPFRLELQETQAKSSG